MDGKPLIWLSSAPYEGSRMRAGLDTALAFAAFAQQPQVLVSDAAVLALLHRQAEPGYREPSLRKLINSLPLYDVETLWVDAASLEAYGIAKQKLPEFSHCLTHGAATELLGRASHVLCY